MRPTSRGKPSESNSTERMSASENTIDSMDTVMQQENEAMDDELLRALEEASDEAGVNISSALFPSVSSLPFIISVLEGERERETDPNIFNSREAMHAYDRTNQIYKICDSTNVCWIGSSVLIIFTSHFCLHHIHVV